MSASQEYSSEGTAEMTKEIVLLPKDVKVHVQLNLTEKVRSIKENILRDNNIPFPIKYIMVVTALHGDRIVLDDNMPMGYYTDYLRFGTVELKRKSSEIERPPRAVKLENFNINLK